MNRTSFSRRAARPLAIAATVVVVSTTAAVAGASTQPGVYAYIADYHGSAVAVVDVATNTVRTSIPVTAPLGVALTPDGQRVYVASYQSNALAVIETAGDTIAGTIPVGQAPEGVAVAPDGRRVYATNGRSASVSVVDVADGAVGTVAGTVQVGNAPTGVAVSPDGDTVYVANQGDDSVSILDAEALEPIATVAVADGPYGVAVTPDGHQVYVANQAANSVSVIDVASGTVVRSVTVGGSPTTIVLTPDSAYAYVTRSGSNTVAVLDTRTDTVVANIVVGGGPFGAAATPDGSQVYVTSRAENGVSVIDTETNTVVGGPVPVGEFPFAVAIGAVPAPLALLTTSLPGGRVNVAYQTGLEATGGYGDHRWSVTHGDLPAGLVLDTETGAISGTPTGPAGAFAFTVQVADESVPARTSARQLSMNVEIATTKLEARQARLYLLPPPRIEGLDVTLTDALTGVAVRGQTVTFETYGGTRLCSAVTDNSGRATCWARISLVTALSLQTRGYVARFAGTATFAKASTRGSVVLVVGLGARRAAGTG